MNYGFVKPCIFYHIMIGNGKKANDSDMYVQKVHHLSDLGDCPHNLSVLRNKNGNDKIFSCILDYGGTRNAGNRDDSAGRQRQESLCHG